MACLGRIIAWPASVVALFLIASELPLRSQPSKDLRAPPRLPGESLRTLQRFADAGKLAAEGRLAESVDEYQRLIEEAGDDLLPTDPKQPRHLVQVRRLCHLRLASLPPAGLKVYRSRVDDSARKRFEQAAPARDEATLRRIVDETFCSRHTDRALDLMGDLAFERGDFEEAERCWRMLLPTVAATDLVFPDPQTDPALVRAKLILAKWYRGERRGTAEDLTAFRKAHSQADGTLAGRKGNYGETLLSLMKQADPGRVDGDDWPTFAGGADRNRILPVPPRLRWVDQPWRVRLDSADPLAPLGPPLTPSRAAQTLAFLPAVVGDRVVVADARGVTVFDLYTGRRLGRWNLQDDLKVKAPLEQRHDERFTVTVAGNRAFVRVGAAGLSFPKADRAAGESYLVCLDLAADGKPVLRWHTAARTPEMKDPLYWEGSPVVQAGRAYIAWTQFAKSRGMTGIDCYDADTGVRLWRQDVCEAQEDGAEPRYRHHLLTLAGPYLAYCSHAGAVVVLDPATGKRVWAVRYPRRGYTTADGNPIPRDLAPCAYAAGKLYVAPADADRIFCFDASGGRLLWESKTLEVVHLLGVARGKVIVTTGTVPRGIRALDAETGQDLRHWIQPDDGSTELPPLGRGLLAGDLVYWPTRDGLRVLSQEDGQPSADGWVPHGKVPGGNLAVGRGCLIVATDRELLGYIAPARLLGPRKAQVEARPDDAAARLQLALAQADGGQHAEAIQSFQKVGEPAIRREHELLREMAREEKELPPPALVTAAQAVRFPVELRLQARAELAEAWARAEKRDRAGEAWQVVLDQEELRSGTFFDAVGIPHLAGNFAAARIAALTGKTVPEAVGPPPKADPAPAGPIRLEPAWQVHWQGSRRLLSADDGTLIFQEAGSSALVSLAATTGKECWRVALGESMVWAARQGDRVLAGGPRLVVCIGMADGKVRWQLTAPSDEDFGSFRLSSGRLFLLLGDRKLIAYDLETCRLLWHHSAPGGKVRPNPPDGSFHTDFFVDAKLLAIQTGSGKLWLIRPDTGKTEEALTSPAPWPRPPIRLSRDLLLLTPDPHQLHGFWLSPDPSVAGGPRWKITLDRPASLTGEPPQVLFRPRTLIVFVPRNYGGDLERWDPETSEVKWRKTLFLGRQSFDLSLAGLDDRNLYLMIGREAQALRLADGERLWKGPLPGSGDRHRLVATPDGLLACPVEAKVELNRERVLSWLLRAEPTILVPTLQPMSPAGMIAGLRLTTMEANAPSKCSLFRLDPVSGKVMQRLDFASRGKEVYAWLGQGRMQVVVADAAWSFK